MNTLLTTPSATYPPAEIDFTAETADLARYDGRRVRTTFTVTVTARTMNGLTVLGAKQVDEFSRVAYIPAGYRDTRSRRSKRGRTEYDSLR